MGEVFLAHDPRIDRKVALKVLHKDHLGSKVITNRFLKEAKAIGRLSHPDIVSVYDVGQDHGTIFIAMEYLEGRPLNNVIKSKKLDIAVILKIGRQVAEALDYAHQKGIIHRDIKPSNLMLSDNGNVKLTDFGIAHFEDASLTLKTRSGDILGTPAYMSPEQIAGKAVDNRSDLYSLGVILYELMVGQRPFVGNNLTALFSAITQHRPLAPVKANSAVPKSLSSVIMQAMAKQPEQRFQTGAALASALNAHLPNGIEDGPLSKGHGKALPLKWAAIVVLFTIFGWQLYHHTGRDPSDSASVNTDSASVNITSDPPNASIYLNNAFKGRTPLRCELPLGLYDVRLTLTGHFESEAQIDVNESGDMPVHLRLIPEQ
jgi:serine/threonine protein kinase